MEKKFYVKVTMGNSAQVIPIVCQESQIDAVAIAIGKGYKAESCAVYENSWDSIPIKVLWDTM